MFFVGKEKSSSLLQLGGAEEIDLRTQPYSISTGEGEGEGEGGASRSRKAHYWFIVSVKNFFFFFPLSVTCL